MFDISMSGLSKEYFLFEDGDDSKIGGEDLSRWRVSVMQGAMVRMSAEAMLPAGYTSSTSTTVSDTTEGEVDAKHSQIGSTWTWSRCISCSGDKISCVSTRNPEGDGILYTHHLL